eukprot:gene46531-56976_t
MDAESPSTRHRLHASILETIGDTPAVLLPRLMAAEGLKARLALKLEFFNPAGSVKDRIGLAMVEGRLSQAGMLRIGPDLTRVLLMGRAPPDRVEIRCFALSFAAEDGLLQSEALLLESSAGRITGNLAVNLRNETIAAHLRPDLRVFGATMLNAAVPGRALFRLLTMPPWIVPMAIGIFMW